MSVTSQDIATSTPPLPHVAEPAVMNGVEAPGHVEHSPLAAAPSTALSPVVEKDFAIARIGQARQALADMLMSYTRMLQSNDDPTTRIQLRAELAGLLVDKDPELLDTIIDLAGKRRKSGGPRVLELFNGFCALATRLESSAVPQDDEAWKQLCEMADKLLATYKGRLEEILPHVRTDGVAQHFIPAWIREAEASLKCSAAADRVPGMQAQSPAHYLSGDGFKDCNDALDELCVAGMDEAAEQLASHVCKSLSTSAKDDRSRAVAGIALLIESGMDQNSRHIMQLEDALIEGCGGETSEAVLKTFMNYFLERIVSLYNRGYYARAIRHATTIDRLEKGYRHAMGEEAMNPVREMCSELAKSAWAKNLPESLLMGGEREEAAGKILSAIDRNLSTTLIAAIGREDKIQYARVYASYLKKYCPGSARALFTIMSSQNDPATLSRMLTIAPEVGSDEEILEMIFPLLVHSNFELRGAAMQLVLDRDNEATANFIAQRLHDPRTASQRDIWMGVLSKLRHLAASQVVMNELQAELDAPMQDDRRLMALIEASNAHEDARFGTLLLKMLRPIAGLNETRRVTAVARENAKALKLAGMRAVARYLKDPRVFECLERLRREPDQDIARMAAYCLSAPADLLPKKTNVRVSAPPAPGMPAAPGMPLPPGATPPGTPNMRVETAIRSRRGFEELEMQQETGNADAIFKPGNVISGKQTKLPESNRMLRPVTPIPNIPAPAPASAPAPGNPLQPPSGIVFSGKQTPVDPSELPEDIFTGLKPLLEGELSDLGLGMTARITCAKNGVLVVHSSLGKGALFIQNKVVVAAFFSGMSDIQALAAIGRLKQAKFAYYAKSFSYAATMSVEVSNIETAIREYLDMR